MSLKSTPGLYEFLEDAELTHYYVGLKNILQVQHVGQLKNVKDDDLQSLGMSKSESKRLKSLYNKQYSSSYASKLRKLLGRKDDINKDEFLLGEDLVTTKSSSSIRVPMQHLISVESVTVYKELGVGEFGVVQQGVWTDEDGMRHQVAVKCLSKKRMQNNTVEFMKEYEMMQSIDHHNIVGLYGVVLDSESIMLITELAPLRSLLECLREPSLRSTFTVLCLAEFCQQICQGMIYLEDKRLIHRDLAARNILVFSKSLVKISDFGLSRALGVGKDYYQTNFNVNLKLPIAWCAPECINFLKFTSSSDVWAFGVTMWEMFSYGFQPWAAMTGHQILEAIDEEGGQRLEKPTHCPREHYQIMEATWRHRPDDRPSFKEVGRLLEEARPEQVQVIVPGGGPGLMQYNVGDIITVLDKRANMEHTDPAGRTLWLGVNTDGKVGLFLPSHTVTYLGNLPASQVNWTPQQEQPPQPGIFTRAGIRGSKEQRSSRRKISRDMISGPTGTVQHTGHVGPDGVFFGDVTFISGGGGGVGGSSNSGGGGSGATVGGRLPSTGSDNGFSSWKADSDASESAPLLSSSSNNTRKSSSHDKQNQPRMMGHAIGYLRKQPDAISEPLGAILGGAGGVGASSSSSSVPVAPLHQYQSISDEENEDFGSPLDLGPSLMDEVFSELENYDNLQNISGARKEEEKLEDGQDHPGIQGIVDTCHKFADKVTTMTLSRKHKGKKAAYVRPIKASDEKTLENAILMANQIASKSMHDLDKRCTDDMFNASPQVSPMTPNSPTKKFSFKFPSVASSGKHKSGSSHSPTRHFTDEVNSRSDMNTAISPTARDAYKVLIEGDKPSCTSSSLSSRQYDLPPTGGVGGGTSSYQPEVGGYNPEMTCSSNNMTVSMSMAKSSSNSPSITSHRLSLPPTSSHLPQSFSSYNHPDTDHHMPSLTKPELLPLPHTSTEEPINPLPLPPKDRKSSVTSGGKRHTRKNPLIIPSGMAASMARRAEATEAATTATDNIPGNRNEPLYAQSSMSSLSDLPIAGEAQLPARSVGRSIQQQQQQSSTTYSTANQTNRNFDTYNDAFEEEIACNIDALDNLQEGGGQLGGMEGAGSRKGSLYDTRNQNGLGDVGGELDRVGHQHLMGGGGLMDGITAAMGQDSLLRAGMGKSRRGVDSDEVRIMTKVLGGVSSDKNDCLAALNVTDWNVHKAIKIIKLKRLIPSQSDASFSELKISLMNNDWDIVRAATLLK